ncbi:hypothetical protein WJX73_000255 [Symbiochloris irregularis]|uniref:NADP-dependent oxidoreductase domain-containing protein n=1 Tax=Symbiochloris irregularis TaxID=706552 RepID=A0AAW1PFJ4_9CHLO
MVGQRKLGRQGLVSSEQGLGCMSLTDGMYKQEEGFNDDTSLEVLNKAFELGITMLNTAAFYSGGKNEELIGRAIKGLPRDKAVIASKFGPSMKDGKFSFDASPAALHKTIDETLSRLGVDYLDVWVLRNPGFLKAEQVEEILGTVKEIVKAGKVKYVGLSEVSADIIRRAHKVQPISVIELEWSLFSRDSEAEIIPAARELGIGILAYSPMSRGMLSGAFTKVEDLAADDWRRSNPRFQGENFAKNVAMAGKIKAIADKKGCTSGQIALAWVAHQGDDVVPIPGTKRVKYLEINVEALKIKLTPAEMKELEDAVPGGMAAGDRYQHE